jgi:hypothetical protein
MSGKSHLLGIGLVNEHPPYTFASRLRRQFFGHARGINWLLKYKWANRIPFDLPAFPETIKHVDEFSSYWNLIHRKIPVSKLPLEATRRAEEKMRKKKEQLRRKYGSGGESSAHKELKRWVLDHPAELSIGKVVRRRLEYELLSGDRADVMFDLPGGRYAVIEVETDDPLPGAHQALKYRVLKCAEVGLDIKSPQVEAILVAWKKPDDSAFLKRYGIRFFQKRL